MYNLFTNCNLNTRSVADCGANRVLGTNGSVTGYINTGRTGSKALNHDKYVRKTDRKRKIDKIIKFSLGAIVTAGLLVALKKRGIKPDDKSKLLALKDSVFEKLKKAKTKTGDFLSKIFRRRSNNGPKRPNILKRAFSKLFRRRSNNGPKRPNILKRAFSKIFRRRSNNGPKRPNILKRAFSRIFRRRNNNGPKRPNIFKRAFSRIFRRRSNP